MKIRMYNVGFGDCFCLRDRNKSLMVDFGTSNSRIDGRTRREVFDVIISDLTTIARKNLLLTHFHLDHLSGLLYMMKHRSSSYDFGKIYLSDVFSEPGMSHTLALLLLADLVKNSYLPSRQVSLFALVEALCKKPQKVELLYRGKEFEGKYEALWPDRDIIREETEKIFSEIEKSHGKIMGNIVGFAEKLRQIVCSMTENARAKGDAPAEAQGQEEGENQANGKVKPAVNVLDREFRELRAVPEFCRLVQYLEAEKTNLRQFKNKISVVFQNARDGELNLLFTGDVPTGYLQMIAENYDGKVPLHEHYWCVKVPHHGTEAHYFDFSSYSPENMLISNGVYYANGKKQCKAYRISPRYAGLFYINDAHMYCSNCDCCDGYRNGCTCKESDVIAPMYYKDI